MPISHMDAMENYVDPFVTVDQLPQGEVDPAVPTAGRYRLPELIRNPDGTVGTGGKLKGGRQRVTTLVKAIGDSRALDLWHQRQLLLGLVSRPDLFDLACATVATSPEDCLRADLEDIAARVLVAAGADVGATRGTAFHGFTEAQDLGLMHFARQQWHAKLQKYRDGMSAQMLKTVPEYVERIIVVEKYNIAGTVDRFLWDLCAEVHRVGDLKTQKKFWSWAEIAAQLAAYAMADAMWDRANRCFVNVPKIANDYGVVAWAPHEGGMSDQVDFFDVDLVKGRETLDLAYRVDRLRSEARSKRQTWAMLRTPCALGQIEAFARRLETIGTLAEGSAVWAEIEKAGLEDHPVLLDTARMVRQRLTKIPQS